jgi:hypothetical protein
MTSSGSGWWSRSNPKSPAPRATRTPGNLGGTNAQCLASLNARLATTSTSSLPMRSPKVVPMRRGIGAQTVAEPNKNLMKTEPTSF